MTMDPSDISIGITEDRPRGGMWHCGPNAAWVTATHKPTGIQARAYSRSQHRARAAAMMALELMVDDVDGCPPVYLERVNEGSG